MFFQDNALLLTMVFHVVVPMTSDRMPQLNTLKQHWRRHYPDCTITVAEQTHDAPFDLGRMRNAAAVLAMVNNEDTVCFCDVDIVPLSADVPMPQHRMQIVHAYGHTHSLGGVVLMTGYMFRHVDGWPCKASWGGEDVAMSQQCGNYVDKSRLVLRFTDPLTTFAEVDLTGRIESAKASERAFRIGLPSKLRQRHMTPIHSNRGFTVVGQRDDRHFQCTTL